MSILKSMMRATELFKLKSRTTCSRLSYASYNPKLNHSSPAHHKKTFSSSPSTSSSSSSSFDTVGIVGLGLMGHGICQVAATAAATSSSSIIAYEPKEEFLSKGKERITKSLSKLVSKEKMTQQNAERIIDSITFTTDIHQLSDSDLIVEAVIENMALKHDLYTSLNDICKDTTIFASNTSSLSITEMAEIMPSSSRKSNFLGVHFFNPVQIMNLVEVIHTKYTDPDVFDKVYNWVEKEICKVPVRCGDTPGFIVNRLLVPSLMQAMLMVDRNDASVKDIDLSMKLGMLCVHHHHFYIYIYIYICSIKICLTKNI